MIHCLGMFEAHGVKLQRLLEMTLKYMYVFHLANMMDLNWTRIAVKGERVTRNK